MGSAATNAFACAILVLCVGAGRPARAAGDARASKASTLAGSAVAFYQRYISDLRYGHCRFDPSCSRYAARAIEDHGFLAGVVLTADRLIRCNERAYGHYPKLPDGRLADPVDVGAEVSRRPAVPAWLLPGAADPPWPLPADSTRVARLSEYVAFADALAQSGDCWRAETEYRRVAFLMQTDAGERWALMKSGMCRYRQGQYDLAAGLFQGAAESDPAEPGRGAARFMAAASYFNEGEYRRSCSTLGQAASQGERAEILRGLSSMMLGNWDAGASCFESAAVADPDSPNLNQLRFFQWKAEAGAGAVPRKHPALAATLAVVPGMGHVYTGRYFDGFRHFLFDGLLMVSVYQLFDRGYYAGGYLLAGFTLPFYVGNIVGAKRSAESANATRRAEYVSLVIDRAASQ